MEKFISNSIFRNLLKLLLLIFIILEVYSSAFALNIDSLQNELSAEITENSFKTLISLSKHYLYSNPDTAYYYSQKASKIAELLNKDNLRATALNIDASCLYYLNRKEEAIESYKKEIVVLERLGENSKKISAYYYIAMMYKQFGKYDLAVDNYRKSLENSVLEDYIPGQIEALRGIGVLYSKQSKYDIALDYYFKALKLAQSNGLKKNEGNILNNIGSIYRETENSELALKYYKQALAIRLNLKDSAGMSGAYNNIGIIYKNREQYDSALVYYQTAFKINKEIMFWRYASINLGNIGVVYKRMGEYEKALEYIFQAVEMEKELKLYTKLYKSYNNIGSIYLLMGEYDKAMKYYQMSLDNAVEFNNIRTIGKAHLSIHDVYLKKGNFEKALEHFKIYQKYQDSISIDKVKTSIAEIQTKYETEEKEKENQVLKKEQDFNSSLRTYLYLISAALLVILIFLIYLFIQKSKLLKRNKQYYEKEKELNIALKKNAETEKKRFEELIFAEQKINELQREKIIAKNKELSSVVLNVHNKNIVLSQLKKEIDRIQKSDQVSDQEFSKINQLVDGKTIIEEDWNVFKEQIESVYFGFFDKLKTKYPDLTKLEQRLCSYLLIDLSTREIAGLFNVTLAAVSKNRQRLRKKLNLGSNDDFAAFLRQI